MYCSHGQLKQKCGSCRTDDYPIKTEEETSHSSREEEEYPDYVWDLIDKQIELIGDI